MTACSHHCPGLACAHQRECTCTQRAPVPAVRVQNVDHHHGGPRRPFLVQNNSGQWLLTIKYKTPLRCRISQTRQGLAWMSVSMFSSIVHAARSNLAHTWRLQSRIYHVGHMPFKLDHANNYHRARLNLMSRARIVSPSSTTTACRGVGVNL